MSTVIDWVKTSEDEVQNLMKQSGEEGPPKKSMSPENEEGKGDKAEENTRSLNNDCMETETKDADDKKVDVKFYDSDSDRSLYDDFLDIDISESEDNEEIDTSELLRIFNNRNEISEN